jgi:tRNA-(ms[2]io[6]A)-hydroxylase
MPGGQVAPPALVVVWRRATVLARMELALAPLTFVTPRDWALRQCAHVDELLVEQAHLEKKAAAAAVQFLFRVPIAAAALRGVSALAREELVHFERTLRLLERRGVPFAPQPPSAYADRLKAAASSTMPARLADELLLAAIIEARSHERMLLLAAALQSAAPEVADFYADLCEAEARHAPLYAEVAAQVMPPGWCAGRHRELIAHEAAVLHQLPWSPRLHSGVGSDATG